MNHDIEQISCNAFLNMSTAEQEAFVIGVANGRGMTSGLFHAYAGAAQEMAETSEQKEAISESYETIYNMLAPILEIDAMSLLNGIRAACRRPENGNEFVINALASVHLDVVKALREHREQEGS